MDYEMKTFEDVTFQNGLEAIQTTALGLIPDGEFVDEKPKPKTYEVEIEGMDGKLDYTEATTGTVKFGNRKLTMPFTAIVEPEEQRAWMRTVMTKLHGKKFPITLASDPSVYYYGRVTVDIRAQGRNAKVKIFADCDPYLREWEPATATDADITANTTIINLSNNNVASEANLTEFRYGANGQPYTDWSMFNALTFSWTPNAPTYKGKKQVKIGVGSVEGLWYHEWSVENEGYFSLTKRDLNMEGIDLATINLIRIGVAERAMVSGSAVVKTIEVNAGAKAAELTTTTTATGAKVLVGGNVYKIPAGTSADEGMVLQPGTNYVYTSASAPVTLRWNREWMG